MEIKEIIAERILNPTSIDLGQYVINPYKGCAFSCLYCYARFSKTALKENRTWGEYVDVKINSADLLRKEIEEKKPGKILIGSTTECFLPMPGKYSVIRDILDILNEYGVYYSILTRSPLVTEYLEQLKSGFCERIYFTVNDFSNDLKMILEPGSPGFKQRIKAACMLQDNDINVIPYFSPVLPGISDIESIFKSFNSCDRIELEGLNFNLGNIDRIIVKIAELYSDVSRMYAKMKKDQKYYEEVWAGTEKEIKSKALKYKRDHNIFIHEFSGYFENSYTNSKK